MITAFASPSTYVQGDRLLQHAARYIAPFGNHGLLIADDIVWELVGGQFYQHLTADGLKIEHIHFNGESSPEEIARIQAIGEAKDAKFVIALGGGKTNDTTKAVGDQLHVPVVIVPTLASNDSPCTRLSVIYSPNGEFLKYQFYNKNPDLVLVDSTVIAGAPCAFWSMGLRTRCRPTLRRRRSRGPEHRRYYPADRSDGRRVGACREMRVAVVQNTPGQAVSAAADHVVTPALSHIIEANILLSGVGPKARDLPRP